MLREVTFEPNGSCTKVFLFDWVSSSEFFLPLQHIQPSSSLHLSSGQIVFLAKYALIQVRWSRRELCWLSQRFSSVLTLCCLESPPRVTCRTIWVFQPSWDYIISSSLRNWGSAAQFFSSWEIPNCRGNFELWGFAMKLLQGEMILPTNSSNPTPKRHITTVSFIPVLQMNLNMAWLFRVRSVALFTAIPLPFKYWAHRSIR